MPEKTSEAPNAGGIRPPTPDLLKDHILSVVAGSNQFAKEDFDKRWTELLEQLGETEFADFLRIQQGMEATLSHKNNLYKVIKHRINHPETIFPYLEKLEESAPVYVALKNPEDEFWRTKNSGQYQQAITYLNGLKSFKSKAPLSLLMAGFLQFETENFIKLLQYILAMTIRGNALHPKYTSGRVQLYNKIANQVCKGLSVAEVADQLKPLYPKDEEFENSFAKKSMHSGQKSKFLLLAIEQYVGNTDPPQSLTLEHVLPKKSNGNWQKNFGKENVKQAINRLGNIALLPKVANAKVDQKGFSKKREVLLRSGYTINEHVAGYSKWDINALNDHQKWLAEQAKAVWKIP